MSAAGYCLGWETYEVGVVVDVYDVTVPLWR